MRRERALEVVLVLLGVLFLALIYPMMLFVKQEPALAMMLSLYVTLGIFLLHGSSRSLRASQLDRVHGMVELRSRRRHGGAGIP